MTTRTYSADGALLHVDAGTIARYLGAYPAPGKPPPERPPVNNPPDKSLDRTHAILSAIAEIQAANAPELLTGDGRPRIDAIERIVGFDISVDERDAAWQIHIDEED